MSFDTFDNQFYPTPPMLAIKAFFKFKNRDITRLLEPQAGRGDLADIVNDHYSRHDKTIIDCVEIDLANQAILREKGYRVVGLDFLKYRGAAVYSHILMNPPFREAAKHVLHAWELLFSGELVAIVGANTIRNPGSREDRQLAMLLNDVGATIEFVQEAFTTADTKRKTRVEVAIIHMEKVSTKYDDFIDGLRKDVEQKHEPAPESKHEVMVPRSFIDNLVINFECAVEAGKQACVSQARANHYANRFSKSITHSEDQDGTEAFAVKSFNKVYDDLKERAWSTVLRSTTVLEKLSSQAQKRIEAGFKDLCALEFTYDNVWGFLDGLIAQQGQIQVDMVCDVFDMISRYHTENRAYYMGWKSNDKHRLNAFRIKTSRFILGNAANGYQGSSTLSWENTQRFRDFDKVFAMLDGKKPENTSSIEKMFTEQWDALRAGDRCVSDYFEARYYRKRGSFHLFPKRKDLIDKINGVVGRARQWLPHDKSAAPPAFWQQYEAADKIAARMPDLGRLEYWAFRDGKDEEPDHDTIKSRNEMMAAYRKVAGEMGIEYDPSMLIEREQVNQFPRLGDDRSRAT